MKHTTEELLLAAQIRLICQDLRSAEAQAERKRVSPDADLAAYMKGYAHLHPLTEYVPQALEGLEGIATAVHKQRIKTAPL